MAEENVQEAPTPTGGDTPEPAGGTPAAADTVSAETPQEESPRIAFTLADETGPGAAGSDEPAQVPSYRLREETARAQRAEAEAAAMRAMIASRQNGAAQPGGVADPEAELRNRFGTEEEGGPKAYEAVRDVADARLAQAIQQVESNLRREFSGQINNKVGAVTSSLASAQKLSDMRARGLLDEAGERMMSQKMGQMVQANAQWGSPQNADHLINTVYMEMLNSGQIKPVVQQPVQPGTPSDNGNSGVIPGGAGGGVPRMTEEQKMAQWDAELLEVQKANPNQLGGLSIERLREIDPYGGPQESVEVAPGERKFVHTRT